MPHAETLMKLRNGKVRREKRTKSKRIVGEARVLTYTHVNHWQKISRALFARRAYNALVQNFGLYAERHLPSAT